MTDRRSQPIGKENKFDSQQLSATQRTSFKSAPPHVPYFRCGRAKKKRKKLCLPSDLFAAGFSLFGFSSREDFSSLEMCKTDRLHEHRRVSHPGCETARAKHCRHTNGAAYGFVKRGITAAAFTSGCERTTRYQLSAPALPKNQTKNFVNLSTNPEKAVDCSF